MSFVKDDRGRVRWTRLRRCSQIFFLLVFLLLPVSYHFGQHTVMGTLASLKLGPVSLVDPAAGLSTAIAAHAIGLSLVGGLILPALLATVLGPVFCSWVCPWGLLTELLDRFRSRTLRRAKWVGPLRWTFLGAVMVLSLAVGLPLAALISAPRLMTALPMELIYLGGASVATLSLLGGLLAFELALPRRLWCRALCPVGSVLVLLGSFRRLWVVWCSSTCRPAECGLYGRSSCSWRLDPRHLKPLDGCTNCGRCVEDCPSTPSPSLSFSLKGRPADARLPVASRPARSA